MTRVAVALGSNLGDRLGHLRQAVGGLRRLGRVEAVSSLYETAPVGGPQQGPYLNAVVLLDTELDLLELLDRLQELEAAAGRRRRQRWGPRTLDLDVVAYDGPPLEHRRLLVPHPRAAERRFVLEPLAEVWPQAPVAVDTTAADALPATRSQQVFRWRGNWVERAPGLGSRGLAWVTAQFLLILAYGTALGLTGQDPPESDAVWASGGLVALWGLGLTMWGLRSLGGRPSTLPQPRAGATLVTHGPYRLVRHPVYGGMLLVLGGLAVLFRSLPALALVAALGVLFWGKTADEERNLLLVFPEYEEYRRRVRRRLIPGLL